MSLANLGRLLRVNHPWVYKHATATFHAAMDLIPRADGERTVRPCHYRELFVTHAGDVYPCCRVWMRPDMRIGNVRDADIHERIRMFTGHCSCGLFRLRKATDAERGSYDRLNVELALTCQGKCAMCCVGAPEWKGKYDLYDSLDRLVEATRPSEMLVQGGEILVQPESLKWLEAVKKKFPSLNISLVSNGNVGLQMLERIENIFSRVAVSMVGFSTATYRVVMGLDFDTSRRFAEELVRRRKIRVFLKFLVVPVNIHEIAPFLDWAMSQEPNKIVIADANTLSYVAAATEDRFWEKIRERERQEILQVLSRRREEIIRKGLKVGLDRSTYQLLKITDGWVLENGLGDIVYPNLD